MSCFKCSNRELKDQGCGIWFGVKADLQISSFGVKELLVTRSRAPRRKLSEERLPICLIVPKSH